jgi:hypothetical protein
MMLMPSAPRYSDQLTAFRPAAGGKYLELIIARTLAGKAHVLRATLDLQENPRTAADWIFVMETRTSRSQNVLAGFIFWSRWLQPPLYVGLIVTQSVYVHHF